MKKYLLLFIVLVISATAANAQSPSWQWAKSGGSADASVSAGMGNEEDVYDMATDPHGNVYVLATVQQTAANVDGHAIPTWGDRDNVVLTSFRCDGTYRWSKVFGNDNGGGQPVAIKTDTLGGIYIAMGIDNYDAVHLDTDSTIPYAAHLRQLLFIKYDTAGNLKWAHWPEPDTLSFAGIMAYNHDLYDVTVDGAGNAYFLCILSPGAYCDGAYIISSPGETMHVLEYNSTGAFVGGSQLDMAVTGYPPLALKMKRNVNDGRFYITGTLQDISGGGTLTFGSTLIDNTMFIGCFNSAGVFLWQRQDTGIFVGQFGNLDLDRSGNIYLTGATDNTDLFNGYVFTNPLTPSGMLPFVIKMDSNGNNIWAKNGYVGGTVAIWSSAVGVNGNEVDIAGVYGLTYTWPGLPDTLYTPLNTYLYNVVVERFNNTTGAIIALDTVASDLGANEFPSAMAVDKYGNFYVGGRFESQMYFSCGDTLTSIGGETDFFVAKYGTPNCDTPHIPALETSPQPSPKEREIAVYPNPVRDELVIENASIGAIVRLYNTVGQQVYSGIISGNKQVVSTENFVSGTYLLQVTDANGNRTNKTIVKQ